MFHSSRTHRQTENLLVCRSPLLDGGHLDAVGDLAEGCKEERKSVSTRRQHETALTKDRGGQRERESGKAAESLSASTERRPVSPPPSTGPTYGASYPHCSLWRPSRAACGCCPRPPCGLGPGRRRSWPRSSGGREPDRWRETMSETAG